MLICALAFISSQAFSAGKLIVSEEVTLNGSADQVWQAIGAFGGLYTWHPAIVSTALTGTGSNAGDTRILTLGDGATVTEVLVDHDDGTMQYSYVIMVSPLPVQNYFSTLEVVPKGENGATVVWSSTFDANGASDEEAIEVISGIYKGGFTALTETFN